MSNISTVQGYIDPNLLIDKQGLPSSTNQGTGFGAVMGQAALPVLTPSIAQNLMHRSMTTGVPNAEMEKYGGYSAVKSMYDAGGGSYSVNSIPSDQRAQLAQQVAATGVGNMSLLVSERMSLMPSALSAMQDNGIDPSSINEIYQRVQQGQASVDASAYKVAGAAASLTPSIAQGLMHRSMTTGVPKSEMDLYGGYDAVKIVYDSNSGAYSTSEIPTDQKTQLAMRVAATGVGNMSFAVAENQKISEAVYQSMAENGINASTISGLKRPLNSDKSSDNLLLPTQAPFVDSTSYIDSLMDTLNSQASS